MRDPVLEGEGVTEGVRLNELVCDGVGKIDDVCVIDPELVIVAVIICDEDTVWDAL